jgi:Protein of unknown function (DUF1573)
VNRSLWLAVLLSATLSPGAAGADTPRVVVSETRFHFGRILAGEMLEHEFVLKNVGTAPVKIGRVDLTSPLVVTRMPVWVAPSTEAKITVTLDTTGLRGRFRGEVEIILGDADEPEANLAVEGEIVPRVEVSPAPAFFLAARRGEVRQASLDIINHETTPLAIEAIAHSQDRFTTTLETVEEGQRYRLTLRLKPDGPGGRHSETIVVHTSSLSEPAIRVVANTILRERVYTFPDDVDFGTVSISSIERDAGLLRATAQTLMVYQVGGTGFSVRVRTDLPQLELTSERGPQGDRYQQTIILRRQGLRVGPIRGSITIETNDSQFPELVVPVSGMIVP